MLQLPYFITHFHQIFAEIVSGQVDSVQSTQLIHTEMLASIRYKEETCGAATYMNYVIDLIIMVKRISTEEEKCGDDTKDSDSGNLAKISMSYDRDS